jgi:hypothetical protein
MNDGDTWWLLILGIAIGASVALLMTLRLPRRDDDLGRAERVAEASWISATIERDGGIAPHALVEEILDLHRAYLSSGVSAGLPRDDRDAVAEGGTEDAWSRSDQGSSGR